MTDALALVAWCCGLFFFLAGTLGVVRFRGLYARLHALTKADNLGLGFIVLGLALRSESPWTWLKLGITWALVLVSSSCVCQLMAHSARLRDPEGPA